MEKYARVLVIIFFLVVANLGLSFYILNKLNKPVSTIPVVTRPPNVEANNSPLPAATAPASIQSDLNIIKAELRAIRDSLEVTGIITVSPSPKP